MFIHCRSAAQHLPHHHCIARGDPLKYLSLSPSKTNDPNCTNKNNWRVLITLNVPKYLQT